MGIIRLILNILSNLSEMTNRETSSDEKIKDSSFKNTKNQKKALFYARQIFDGKGKFQGLDVLLKGKLLDKDYSTYIELRHKFNKYS
jgi:hypothetical protein